MKKRKIWLLTGSVFLVISIIVGIRVGTSPLIKSKFGTVEYCLEKKNHRGSVVDIDGVRFNGWGMTIIRLQCRQRVIWPVLMSLPAVQFCIRNGTPLVFCLKTKPESGCLFIKILLCFCYG